MSILILLAWLTTVPNYQAFQWMRSTHEYVYPGSHPTDRYLYWEALGQHTGALPQPWIKQAEGAPKTLRYPIWVWFYLARSEGECFTPEGALSDCTIHPEHWANGYPYPADPAETWKLLAYQWAPTPKEWQAALAQQYVLFPED